VVPYRWCFLLGLGGGVTFWCRLRKSAKAAAAKGDGVLRPLSQFCSESSVTGKEASLKTVSAWAWLRLFLALHSLSCWATVERGFGIGMPFSQITRVDARAEKIGCSIVAPFLTFLRNQFGHKVSFLRKMLSMRERVSGPGHSSPEGEEARPDDCSGVSEAALEAIGCWRCTFPLQRPGPFSSRI